MSGDASTLPEGLAEALVRAGHEGDGSSAALVAESLSSPVARARVLALRAARRRGLLTAARWRAALGDPDAGVRREALALVAHEPPSPALAGEVRARLGDGDALVAEAAAFALGEHRDAAAVDALSRAARDHDDARVREAAVAALGAIGDERGLAAVIAAVGDRPPVRRRAVVALAAFEGPEVDAALAAAREDRDWQTRSAAEQLDGD